MRRQSRVDFSSDTAADARTKREAAFIESMADVVEADEDQPIHYALTQAAHNALVRADVLKRADAETAPPPPFLVSSGRQMKV